MSGVKAWPPTPPFTVWLDDEKTYMCRECGAFEPLLDEAPVHNRTCPFNWQVWVAQAAKRGLQDLPEDKQVVLYEAGDGNVVIVARDDAAVELREWTLKRGYIGEVLSALSRRLVAPLNMRGKQT